MQSRVIFDFIFVARQRWIQSDMQPYLTLPLIRINNLTNAIFHQQPCGRPPVSGGNPGGGGYSAKFYRGGSAPRSKPLPFYVPFLIEKVPLLHTSYRKWYPFHIASWGFKIFCPFHIPKWQFSLPFPILELVKSLPFHIPPY